MCSANKCQMPKKWMVKAIKSFARDSLRFQDT